MYNCFLSGDKQAGVSLAMQFILTNVIFFVIVLRMYNELLSFVTTYKRFFLSSRSIPAGDILLGHFSPSFKESCNNNFLFLIAYFKIQLLFPPEAYINYFSSSAKL